VSSRSGIAADLCVTTQQGWRGRARRGQSCEEFPRRPWVQEPPGSSMSARIAFAVSRTVRFGNKIRSTLKDQRRKRRSISILASRCL